MADFEHLIALADEQYNVVVKSLNEKRTEQMKAGRPTDAVDDALLAVIDNDKPYKKGLFRREAR